VVEHPPAAAAMLAVAAVMSPVMALGAVVQSVREPTRMLA
jgi:hypothetical protein